MEEENNNNFEVISSKTSNNPSSSFVRLRSTCTPNSKLSNESVLFLKELFCIGFIT